MTLVTQLSGMGILLVGNPSVLYDVPSEGYLRVIEETVKIAGGWKKIEAWHVNTKCDSFTASRGLSTLVNTLGALHGIDVYSLQRNEAPKKVLLPIHPSYSGEPNIG
ncbi:MAG: hypothetical protein AAB570_03025 [Patescibacteria group bacterium]|mgnify:CR=1 FL=1